METILLDILLFLGVVWMLLGIAYLWKVFQRPSSKSVNETTEKPIVTKEQIEQAMHSLVGRSKPFSSPSIPEVPDTSSKEKPADNPNTFAAEKSLVHEENEDVEGTEEDNEMQVAYTMDEPDEDSIVREELQIADAALPEVSPSAILAREVVRVTGWHKNDDTLEEENEAEVQGTLQAIRGTQLMDYIKEATLKQEKDHQRLLAAIRQAEEAELQESDIGSSPTSETDSDIEKDNSDVSEESDRPLSYYL